MVDLIGFKGMPEAGLYAPQLVPPIQPGIRLGLNGMAIGGKRRITVDRKLVCEGMPDNAPPGGQVSSNWAGQQWSPV